MSLTKLTLSVDEALVEKAREYSRRRGTSISQMVSRFLAALPEDGKEEYTPTVRRLLGILPPEADVTDYHRHLEEKYGR
ncbi:MAG: DUF6364 family protein [Gemmatimonadota bacterium]|jgi:hypothetical protein|nr:DUF6364 family protein [Gemmatimonadota bacterium]